MYVYGIKLFTETLVVLHNVKFSFPPTFTLFIDPQNNTIKLLPEF